MCMCRKKDAMKTEMQDLRFTLQEQAEALTSFRYVLVELSVCHSTCTSVRLCVRLFCSCISVRVDMCAIRCACVCLQ